MKEHTYWRSPATIAFSALCGFVWHVIAVSLMGGASLRAIFWPSMLAAGIIAGVATGWLSIRSLKKRGGEESFLAVAGAYYFGMFAYWASFVVLARIGLCIQQGGWTAFDLSDHLGLIIIFVAYGTFIFSIVLIPLAYATRALLWKAFLATTPR